MLTRTPVALLLVLLMPFALGDEAPPPAPLAATAIQTNGSALLAWTPSPTEPDHYNVYGVQDGALTLLQTSHDLRATVTATYQQYAVTAVQDGLESQPTYTGSPELCVWISHSPPNVAVGCLPGHKVDIVVEGALP